MAELNLMSVHAAEADMAAMEVTYDAQGATAPIALLDPPPSVTAALQSTVREPTPDQVASWATIEQVATWAKLKGEINWPPSLVRLVAGEDEDPADLEISELASVPTAHFEAQLLTLKYSFEPRTGTGDNLEEVELDIRLSGIDLGRGRAFYNAARIHANIISSRDLSNELWLESHKAATAPHSTSYVT